MFRFFKFELLKCKNFRLSGLLIRQSEPFKTTDMINMFGGTVRLGLWELVESTFDYFVEYDMNVCTFPAIIAISKIKQ